MWGPPFFDHPLGPGITIFITIVIIIVIIIFQIPESMGGNEAAARRPAEEQAAVPPVEEAKGVMEKPKAFVVDPHNPIYKPGGLPDMPGEKGKGVSVKKSVRIPAC